MIRRELTIFLFVGIATVLVDFVFYRGLMLSGLGTDIAKAFGFIAGTLFSYVANKNLTFSGRRHAKGDIWRFMLLYGGTLAANVAVNAASLHLLAGYRYSIQVAFLLATGCSATLNFLGMKLFVFKAATP